MGNRDKEKPREARAIDSECGTYLMDMDVKIFTKKIEESALAQIDSLAESGIFTSQKIRIMPDVHSGAGCVIGFTAEESEKVVPNLIGVDIGCGMFAAKLDTSDVDLASLDRTIKNHIPSGFAVHKSDTCDIADLGLLCFDELGNVERLNKSLGSLGGGNHFIELNADETQNTYLVIHSGSRNLGLQVAQLYQAKAKGRGDLAFLEGELKDRYLHDMRICQAFARENREHMMDAILASLRIKAVDSFHTVHNYIGDDGITRKGAISAYEGERVLIPFNMRDGSIIGVGKGNADWNYSAPHGAGRIMSRSKARKTLSMDEYKHQMESVYSTTVCKATLDEAPNAYKPAQEILDALEPTVEIVGRLSPLYNYKASE